MTRAGLTLVAFAIVGCASDRDRVPDPDCPTWQDDVAALFAERCATCHSGAAPAGGYDLTSYAGALGPGSDQVANAIAGDPGSALVAVLDPAAADQIHRDFASAHETARTWVVACELAYSGNPIHRPGLMNPADPDFHGALLRELRYDYDGCASCHGADFAGGSAQRSCLGCHSEGPRACTTCHDDAPSSGAHRAHVLGGELGKAVGCETCHVVPADVLAPGHVLDADGELDPAPAEVVLSGLAGDGATFAPATGTCVAYCHQPNAGDTAATGHAPRWTDTGTAGCGSCHGVAPSSHADDRCAACHRPAIGVVGLDPALHIDGVVQVGSGCTGCHGGGAAGAAPPPDLAGASATDLVTIGAHAAHVLSPARLRGPIPCSDCHREPATLDAPGHIDSAGPAEVFPAGFGGLAAAGGAVPAWDRASATCADVYCHGGGTTRMSMDTAPGLARTPVWTALGAGAAACGACHGVPPVDGLHAPALTLFDCASCHSQSVAPTGVPILVGDPATSRHMNGVVDVD